jgi:Holliday junction resolvasome RuvABC endonuclease subunit
VELEGKGTRRLEQARLEAQRLLERFRPQVVVVEGYSFASPNRAHELGEVGGVVRLYLHDQRVPWFEASPSTRMKVATGKGQASKGAVLAEAVRRLQYQGHSEDEADALWLLELIRQRYQLTGAAKLPASHVEALARITWPELVG